MAYGYQEGWKCGLVVKMEVAKRRRGVENQLVVEDILHEGLKVNEPDATEKLEEGESRGKLFRVQ